MAKSNNKMQDQFQTRIVPIKDKVRDELCRLRADEQSQHNSSLSVLFAGAAGPDGGMASMDAAKEKVRQLGKWNRKTVDDYIGMVKAELAKEHIKVDAVTEKKMVDYLIHQQMPKSTLDYMIRRAAKESIFYLPERSRSTALQDHIDKEGEKKHDPSFLEEAAGSVLSWLANATTTMGAGGFWGQTALDGATAATSHYAKGQQDKYLEEQKKKGKQEVAAASKQTVTIPKWMLTQMGFDRIADATDKQLAIAQKWANENAKSYRKKVNQAVDAGQRTVKASGKTDMMSVAEATSRAMQYEAFSKAIAKEVSSRKLAGKDAVHYSNIEEANDIETSTSQSNDENGTNQGENPSASLFQAGDYSGWNGILDALGMNGMSDTMQHLGLTLAMLPDMLLGVFTGKTKSIGLNQGTLMPLAALISGTFIKNPFLKIPLMLFGGANLVNKMGQEALAEYRGQEEKTVTGTRYKRYDDEVLNVRMKNPQIEGNVLLVDIDNVPRLVTLPQAVMDAYKEGALPINVIANRILAKTDQLTEVNQREVRNVSEQYEQNKEREQVRGIR